MAGILIIGGGILQIPALKRARELGYETYLTDRSRSCAARPYADYFFEIDINNFSESASIATELAKQGKISGVYTQGTDAEYTVACAASAAGLFGIDPSVARTCKNKVLMREALRNGGVEDTPFQAALTYEDCVSAAEILGFPLYIKPSDNSASRGITRVSNLADLEEAYMNARGSLLTESQVLLETEMIGTEHSVDTVIYDGVLYPAGISDRIFLEKDVFAVQTESVTPSTLPAKIQENMYQKMKEAAKAIGVNYGAFKGDLIVDALGNVRIIEVTARTSGGFDSQYRKPLSFGIDILKATIEIAMGRPLDPLDLIPKFVMQSKTYSLMPQPGVVESVIGLDEAKNIPGVHDIIVTCKEGDVIDEYRDCSIRTNFITISAPTTKELQKIQNLVAETFIIKTTRS